ncbi:MAG: 30S ribosome-binding factor RbfA [Candidatus Omnitrophota bacterium]
MSRSERVAQALKKEISCIIHDELKDPRLGFVTITQVDLTQDLRSAKVFYSVLGKKEDFQKTKEALESSLGFIRRLIGQRIRLRFTPELMFREDHSSEYGMKIEKILNEIKEQDEPEKDSGTDKKPE